MDKLYELLDLTRKNTAEAERIAQRLEALNKEMAQGRKEGDRWRLKKH